MPRKAITSYRNVTIAFDDAAGQDIVDQTAQIAAPPNAFKAALEKVQEIEGEYAKTGSFTDLAAATLILTANNPHEIHVFTVTTTIASGDYIFIYVETVPTIEDIS